MTTNSQSSIIFFFFFGKIPGGEPIRRTRYYSTIVVNEASKSTRVLSHPSFPQPQPLPSPAPDPFAVSPFAALERRIRITSYRPYPVQDYRTGLPCRERPSLYSLYGSTAHKSSFQYPLAREPGKILHTLLYIVLVCLSLVNCSGFHQNTRLPS